MMLFVASIGYAQIPFEVMIGDKQTQYFSYIQKDIDSAGRWNIFSQSLFTSHYKDRSLNSISMEGQLTYQVTPWLGISGGGAFDGLEFNPVLGLSLQYLNTRGDFYVNLFPLVQFAKPISADFFLLANYTPSFNKTWGLFSQLIASSNLGIQKEFPEQDRQLLNIFTRHNVSAQLLRIGLDYKRRFQFGFGLDLLHIGHGEGNLENAGIFLRYSIE